MGMYLPNQMESPSCLLSVYVLSLPVRHWLSFNREGVEVMRKKSIQGVTQESIDSSCCVSVFQGFVSVPEIDSC